LLACSAFRLSRCAVVERLAERIAASSAIRRVAVAAPHTVDQVGSHRSFPTRTLYTSRAHPAYYTCMTKVRTNIEIEDDYVRIIMDRYDVHTKTDAVDLALRHLAGQPMTRGDALALRGAHAIGEVPADVAPRGAA